jgi:hypothetical protein
MRHAAGGQNKKRKPTRGSAAENAERIKKLIRRFHHMRLPPAG